VSIVDEGGHSSIAMTKPRYAHVILNMQGAAAEKLGDVFGKGDQGELVHSRTVMLAKSRG
jgi:hypothetical protein